MQESTKESYPEHLKILQINKKKPRQSNKGEKSSNRYYTKEDIRITDKHELVFSLINSHWKRV